MKDKKKTRGDGPDMKTWGFAAGAAAFLALLTVVLCLMGGVFKFQKGDAAATGEQMQNRIMYKQYLQAGSFKVMQIDATRVAGPQEIVLEYLLANKFGVRVCPHAGGVGLCEAVRHFAMSDYLAVSGQWDDRVIEYVDNQHEYFVHPTEIVNGRYKAPTAPGSGVDMKLEAAERYLYKG